MKNAVVIGAGITGLRIAEYLSEKGHNITVIEKTSKVGGMTASFNYNGFILDYGPHKFYTQIPGVYDDFKKIVGEGNYLTVKKKNSIRLLGKYFDFPVKISQLLMGMSPILASQVFLGFVKSKLNTNKPRNYEEFFIKGFGKKGYQIIFKGFAEKVWGNPKSLSVELAIRRSPASSIIDVLKTAIIKNEKNVSAEYFFYPKYGYGVMCERLAETIKKRGGKFIFNSVPSRINTEKNKVNSVDIIIKGKKKRIKADVIISSMPITDMPSIIYPKPNKEAISAASNLKFRSLIIAYVFLNKKVALKDNWIFFPEREFCFNRVAEQKSFSPYTAPKDKTVITAEITCNSTAPIYYASDETIKNIVIKDLEKAGLIKKEEVYDFITRKAERVYPIYTLDCKKYLSEVLAYLDRIENFYPTGRLGLFNYNNADHCLDMAKVTADLILSNAPREKWKEAIKYFDSYRIVD